MQTNLFKGGAMALLLAAAFTASAQNINIPDPNFKLALRNSLCVDTDGDGTPDSDADTNNDNQIQLSEALAVTSLYVLNKQIDSLNGIEYFTNLEMLNFSSNRVAAVDLHPFTQLKKLWCSYNKLVTLDLQGLNNLEYLYCGNNMLTTLQVQGLVKLKEFQAGSNNLASLDLNGLNSLVNLNVGKNLLENLNTDGLTTLDFLDCSYNQLTTLNVLGAANLRYLICPYNQLTTLNVQGLVKLLNLNCGANPISALDLQNLPNLDQVTLRYCQLVDLKLQGSHRIDLLQVNNNFLSTLDVSDLFNLKTLECYSNQLEYLNIKNGSKEIFSLAFGSNPNLAYICCDDDQTDAVKAQAAQAGLGNCLVADFCSLVPGGVFYKFIGSSKINYYNDDCATGAIEASYQKYKITNIVGSQVYTSNPVGHYSISLLPGSNTVQPIFENPTFFKAQPATVQVNLPSDTNLLQQDFCLTTNGIHHDVEITLLPTQPASPGAVATYRLTYNNKGNQVESGTVKFEFEDDRMDFVSADRAPDQTLNGELIWNFSNLFPLQKGTINIQCKINKPTDVPPVVAGDILSFNGNIEIPGADEKVVDNFSGLRQVVVGSLDPNDITCLEGDSIAIHLVGDYLHYLIRFENVGTYFAENIVVKNGIDISRFDLSSLQVVDASHPCYARIRHNNDVEFIFENINLPFTEPDKHGFIAYKIKTKPTLVPGNTITNQADIFFDFNLPVVTNKATTVVYETVGTQNPGNTHFYLQLQPNPVGDILQLSATIPFEYVEFYDALGHLALRTELVNGQAQVARLRAGTYFLRCYGQDGVATGRVVKE